MSSVLMSSWPCLLCLLSSEYVQLYVDFLLNKSIYKQFASFYHGFHSVCASDALMVSPAVCVCVCVCVCTCVCMCV